MWTQKLNKYLLSSSSIPQPCIWRPRCLPHSQSVSSHDRFPCILFAHIFSESNQTLHQGSLVTPIGFPQAIQLWLSQSQGFLSLRLFPSWGVGGRQANIGSVWKGVLCWVQLGLFSSGCSARMWFHRPDLHTKYRAHLPHYYCDFIKNEVKESILRDWLSPGKPCPFLQPHRLPALENQETSPRELPRNPGQNWITP